MDDVANSAESTPAAQTPDLSALTETSQSAAPSAETLNTGTAASEGNVDHGEVVPWHQDRRWQSWQKEEKSLRSAAEYGTTWQRAFAENPQFASKVLEIINGLQGTNGQPQGQQNPQGGGLHADPVVNQLLQKIAGLEEKLTSGEEYLNTDRFEKSVSKYKGVFDQVMSEKKIDVHPEYQELFEQNVWRNLIKLNPEVQTSYGFDPTSFRNAVESEITRYQKLTNGIVSGYTSSKMRDGFPQTQVGGVPTLNMPARSESQEDADFATQLKALSGG